MGSKNRIYTNHSNSGISSNFTEIESRIIRQISGNSWTIIFCDNASGFIDEAKGVIVYKDRCIYIDGSQGIINLKRILKHDLSHAYLYETQICSSKYKKYTEEELCEFMAIYGSIIIKDCEEILNEKNSQKECADSNID